MSVTFRCTGLLLALAVMAAPAVGMCVALAGPSDPCEMRASHHDAPCGHDPAVMTGCCSVELDGPDTDGIRPGGAGDAQPSLESSPADAPAAPNAASAWFSAAGDPPPAVPRYRLFSALLL